MSLNNLSQSNIKEIEEEEYASEDKLYTFEDLNLKYSCCFERGKNSNNIIKEQEVIDLFNNGISEEFLEKCELDFTGNYYTAAATYHIMVTKNYVKSHKYYTKGAERKCILAYWDLITLSTFNEKNSDPIFIMEADLELKYCENVINSGEIYKTMYGYLYIFLAKNHGHNITEELQTRMIDSLNKGLKLMDPLCMYLMVNYYLQTKQIKEARFCLEMSKEWVKIDISIDPIEFNDRIEELTNEINKTEEYMVKYHGYEIDSVV